MNDEQKKQEDYEAGLRDNSLDSRAYGKIYEVLRREPVLQISSNFADNVMSKLTDRESWKLSGFELFLVIAGGVFSVITFIAAVVLMNFRVQFGFLDELGGFKAVLGFGAILTVIFHLLDKTVVRKKESV